MLVGTVNRVVNQCKKPTGTEQQPTTQPYFLDLSGPPAHSPAWSLENERGQGKRGGSTVGYEHENSQHRGDSEEEDDDEEDPTCQFLQDQEQMAMIRKNAAADGVSEEYIRGFLEATGHKSTDDVSAGSQIGSATSSSDPRLNSLADSPR